MGPVVVVERRPGRAAAMPRREISVLRARAAGRGDRLQDRAAQRIKAARVALGLPQAVCAAAAGVTPSAWCRWEGGAPPVPHRLAVFCEVTGYTLDWLLRGVATTERDKRAEGPGPLHAPFPPRLPEHLLPPVAPPESIPAPAGAGEEA
jgi:transcriptional regulator with XRE-family HTH domain